MEILLSTNLLCYSPLVIGILAFIAYSKYDGEDRIRNTIFWVIASFSIPWLRLAWNELIKTSEDARFLLWSLALHLLAWLLWLIISNNKNKYVMASQFMLFLGITLNILSHLFDSLSISPQWLSANNMEIILAASIFSTIWAMGILAQNYEVVLFRDR